MSSSEYQLAIDIGNTFTKVGLFMQGHLVSAPIHVENTDWSSIDTLVTNHKVKNIIYSTVANVPPAKWLDKWNNQGCKVYVLDVNRPLPFSSAYQSMQTLGLDRIAAIAGSLGLPVNKQQLSQNTAPAPRRPEEKITLPPRLVVDAGTCVTFDLIDDQKHYHGGNISPGIHMRLNSMHEGTARLPKVEPANLTGWVGTSTVDAMRHGAQLGLVYELEGLYAALLKQFPDLELVLTGGDGREIAKYLSIPSVFHADLVLYGLIQIMSYYVENEF